MFLREADEHNFTAEMEFLHSHHSANSSESPYTLGAGSVGSIEASIPSALCGGGLNTEEDGGGAVNPNDTDPGGGGGSGGGAGAGGDGDDDNCDNGLANCLRLHDLAVSGGEVHNVHSASAAAAAASQLVGEFATSFWVDDMAGFPLPPLDLDPLPPGLFSPCSGGYNWGCARGECVPRAGNLNGEGMADVLLSLKHAVVHPASPTAGYYSSTTTPASHAAYGAPDYGQNLGGPTAPTHYSQQPAMSVNVSMNMTMNMNMNMNMHAGCHACSKAFSQAANLTAHARTHSGEKPFRCPVCDRRFSQSSSVTTHMRTHSGERPYRCRFCKKAFSDSSTLTKHLRIHSGEKPYQCKLCLLRFSQSGNLNRHMRVHGGSLPRLPSP